MTNKNDIFRTPLSVEQQRFYDESLIKQLIWWINDFAKNSKFGEADILNEAAMRLSELTEIKLYD